jgi:nitroreductase
MTIDELEKLIKGRRSIRQWKKDDVPEALLKRAVELATWAPNGGNFQRWQFKVIRNRGVIIKLADAVQAIADKAASWPEALARKEDMERSKKNASYFRNAAACVAVFTNQYQSPLDEVLTTRSRIDDEAKELLARRKSAPTSVQSASAAATTLLLALHAMGLGAVWLAFPLVAKKEVEVLLKVPDHTDFVCLIAVGYPAESPVKERKSVDEVLEFIR